MIPTTEFSRVVIIEPWPNAGIAVDVHARPQECRALADRFGLLELHHLAAVGRMERAGAQGEIVLRCRLRAEVVQACVVSLEPVAAVIDRTIERRWRKLATPELAPAIAEASLVDVEAVEVEPLTERQIDLGEVVAEELGLALDPYPRAPDADGHIAQHLGSDLTLDQPTLVAHPLAGLADLKSKAAR